MAENEVPETQTAPLSIAPKPTIPLPVCPHCGADPCIPDCIPAKFGTLIGRMFICPNPDCRKLFNVELIGEDKPQIHLPGTPRR